MEQQELIALLQQPATITQRQATELKEVLAEYPYFQAARALFLKGLKNQSSLHYNKELKVTAAYTLDRGVLFDYITSEEFNQNEVSNRIKKFAEEAQTASSQSNPETDQIVNLNEALRLKLRESEQVFDPELFSPYKPAKKPADNPVPKTETIRTGETPQAQEEDESQTLNRISDDSQRASNSVTDTENRTEDLTGQESEYEALNLGQPLSFKKEENHSFSEWLRLTQAKPVSREEEPNPNPQSRKFKLIDQFISKSPRIIPSKTAPKPKLVEVEQSAPEALMTETLARVYLEQKNYKKAIQAYKILILKNPEKSGFFADQIRAITKLQEQNS